MHITLVGGYDPRVPSAGGTRTYVESVHSFLAKRGVPHSVVVLGSADGLDASYCAVPVRNSRSTANVVLSLGLALPTLPIPEDSIIHVQRPDHLLPFALHGMGSAWVCTLHGDALRAVRERNGALVASLYAQMEHRLLMSTKAVVSSDSLTAGEYLRRYPALEARMSVIPNGVNLEEFSPGDKESAKRQWGFRGKVLLYAGRLEHEKRVSEIIQAFSSIKDPEATLVIAGDGRDRLKLQTMAAGLKVRFLGAVGHDKMARLLNAADVLVLFSSREALPMVILEALACNVPVISSPVGDIPRIVRTGLNGILVSDFESLTNAMREVAGGSAMGKGDPRSSVLNYSSFELVSRLFRLYGDIKTS